MIDNSDVIKYLDMIREERKLTIQDFTKNVVSRRNYTRFLSGELSISLNLLTKLLEKLQLPLQEFFYYVYNHITLDNFEEAEFADEIFLGNYQKACDEYYQKIKTKKLKTRFSKFTIPCSILLMRYKLGFIRLEEAYYEMKKLLCIEKHIGSNIIEQDYIQALYCFSLICNDYDKELICKCFVDTIINKDYIMLSGNVEITLPTIYMILLNALTTKAIINDEDHILINKVMVIALEYLRRSKTETHDIMIFEILYKYNKRFKLNLKYIVFYYVASIIASSQTEYVKKHRFEIEKEDVDTYLECINDEEFIGTVTYERVMEYGNL